MPAGYSSQTFYGDDSKTLVLNAPIHFILSSKKFDGPLMSKHSHKKRKDSLEGSLDRVLFAAELEFPNIIVPRLLQHTSNVNIECIYQKVRMVQTTVFFIFDQLLGTLLHLNFIILILISF